LGLRKDTFRYIEKEIYDYPQTLTHLQELREDIMYATPEVQEIRSTDISDPTFRTVSILTTHKLKLRMEEIIFVIDLAFVNTLPEIRDILQDKYWHNPAKRWADVAEQYNTHTRQLHRFRSAFVQDIARRLGMN